MRTIVLITGLLLLAGSLFAQPEYYMSNMTVDDCEGYLFDSEQGDIGGNYDHNENYTFTICIPGADQIIMTFYSFCTEANFDSLRIYDGPDTLSNQIGPAYTGEEEPPTIIATSGCLTLNFISDPSVTCTGWVAFWETEVIIPQPPDILPLANLPCESTSLTIEFAEPVPCADIVPGAFFISGPQTPAITSATPLDCNNGFATQVELTFNPMIDFSGNYEIHFVSSKTVCTTTYTLESVEPFSVVDCPLNVVLELDAMGVCVGDELTINALASGGDPNTYVFEWTPNVSNSETATITLSNPGILSVTVTDGNGATASDSILLTPNPPPTLSMGDTTLCSSTEPFQLTANPPGGVWEGLGIGEDNMDSGIYDISMVGSGGDIVTYTDPNGCQAQIQIQIVQLNQGPDEAACPGAPPFQVMGGQPNGGVWSGPFITPDGVFTPPDTAGVFEVVYTHPNGCTGIKEIGVDTISFPPMDTICQSVGVFFLEGNPYGGRWFGPGLIDSLTGEFDPNEAGPGQHTFVYQIQGCLDSMSFFIKEINALWNFSACPEQPPFILPGNWTPMGEGVWSGVGIVDPVTGLYDPSIPGDGFDDVLTFTADNGCEDNRTVFVRQTEVGVESIEFCPEDDPIVLNFENTQRTPGGGEWTGAGIVQDADDNYFFDPGLAGPGNHVLTYERNTCSDQMTMIVNPIPAISPATFCEAVAPALLEAVPPGGVWSGPGVVNENTGLFDPSVAGVGSHTVSYQSPEGCGTQQTIVVTPFEEAVLEGLEDFYCFKDTILQPQLSPANGTLTIDGQPVTTINPADLGAGTHIITYTVGAGDCESSVTTGITVGEPIQIQLPFETDSICFNEGITLTATAFGGSSLNNFTYQWNQGLGFGQSHVVTPNFQTAYTVTAFDGCSDPATATLNVFVHPSFDAEFVTGDPVCFDDTTFAEVYAVPLGDYSYTWDSDPPTLGNYIESYPTSYEVEILDNTTGCWITREIDLPGYDLITANFSLSPNVECVTTIDPSIDILDFSVGALNGYWDFGDGNGVIPYQLGDDLSYTYRDTGLYTITLHIQNEGNCVSEFQQQICVKYANTLFAPNAFSPNGDGINDEFRFTGFGIDEIEWYVVNRYGELLYNGSSMDDGWDGFYRGNRVQQGVYTVIANYKVLGSGITRQFKGFVTVLH